MIDVTTIKVGARLLKLSTHEYVDFLSVSGTEGKATVILPNGLTQDVDTEDLELISLG